MQTFLSITLKPSCVSFSPFFASLLAYVLKDFHASLLCTSCYSCYLLLATLVLHFHDYLLDTSHARFLDTFLNTLAAYSFAWFLASSPAYILAASCYVSCLLSFLFTSYLSCILLLISLLLVHAYLLAYFLATIIGRMMCKRGIAWHPEVYLQTVSLRTQAD